MKLGRWAFAQAVELDKNSAAAYACMENIYIAAGMHMEMNEIEFLRWKYWNVAGKIRESFWVAVESWSLQKNLLF